jgi:hypothetical protein
MVDECRAVGVMRTHIAISFLILNLVPYSQILAASMYDSASQADKA